MLAVELARRSNSKHEAHEFHEVEGEFLCVFFLCGTMGPLWFMLEIFTTENLRFTEKCHRVNTPDWLGCVILKSLPLRK